MTSVAFFNNKGGVGKTTLLCNIAANFARRGCSVLIVDADPQCNATQLVLDAEQTEALYWLEPTAEQDTLLEVIQPISDGDASINRDVVPVEASQNRFGVDVLPGHPRISIVEDQFSNAWTGTKGGEIGGLRRTSWVSALNADLDTRYDFVFYDLGPSLGSLNRTVLLGCDFFVTPMGCDIYSIVGIRNIAEWLSAAIEIYKRGVGVCDASDLKRHSVPSDLPIGSGFAGYTVQQYIAKSKEGVRRPTGAFEEILSQIPQEVESRLGGFFSPDLRPDHARLGDVPNMYSLIPMAQTANAPIGSLAYKDGLRGSQFQQQEDYASVIAHVADRLAENVGLSEASVD